MVLEFHQIGAEAFADCTASREFHPALKTAYSNVAFIVLSLIHISHKVKYARNAVQWAVGLYMLLYLGLLSQENMQIEGFWYYLFLGVFEAAVIHYAVAKIFGPLLFGRGWCGYACWTAMVLDLLPYKTPALPRKNIGWIRYIVFLASLLFVGSLFWLQVPGMDRILFWSFVIRCV